jgi:hypothetical protein
MTKQAAFKLMIGLCLLMPGIVGRAHASDTLDAWVRQVDADTAWQYGTEFGPSGFILTNLPAQTDATFDDAYRLVASRVLGNDTNRLQLSALKSLSDSAHTKLITWGRREVIPPWKQYWLFFADDDPLANWAHPCRYIFVARDLSAIAVQRARTPLNIGLEVLIPYTPPPAVKAKMPAGVRKLGNIHQAGSVSNCYAVIISGGCSTNENGTRFWGDAAFLYSTLTLTYGYPKTNVYAYISDGTNPAVDAVDMSIPSYVNSPTDLDGDGVADTLGEANAANISNVFLHLQGVLQSNDQLLVFVTDHGNHTAGGSAWDSELNLWGNEVIRDADLETLTTNIPCPILFVMEQCYSGGFLDNLDQPRRTIATAAPYNSTSSGGSTFLYYDQWCYEWIAAMRGFYPVNDRPWSNNVPCNGDLNGDGYISFREASHYANAHAPDGDTPMYADHPDHFGSRLFLFQPTNPIPAVTDFVELAPFRTPLATNIPFEARLLAKDPWGNVSTNFSDSVTLEPKADIINPGVTAGHADASYSFLLRTDHRAARTQIIYPTNMMGGARTIDRLALNVDVIPTQTLHRFTIRMRHTPLEVYPLYPTQVVWEADDWVTVYQADTDIVSNGWVMFVFTNAFAYDGIQHLMADFSFSNEFATESASLTIGYDGVTTYRTLQRYSDGSFEDPLSWSGTNPPASRTYIYPYIQFGPMPYQPQVAIVPSNVTGFVDGVWTGLLTTLNAADNVRIFVRTTNAYWDTIVDRFPIREYLFDLAAPQPRADGTYLLNWGSGTGRTYRVMRSTNLVSGFEALATHVQATPPINTYTGAPDSSPPSIFRVEEE